jgi:hypothetical protein
LQFYITNLFNVLLFSNPYPRHLHPSSFIIIPHRCIFYSFLEPIILNLNCLKILTLSFSSSDNFDDLNLARSKGDNLNCCFIVFNFSSDNASVQSVIVSISLKSLIIYPKTYASVLLTLSIDIYILEDCLKLVNNKTIRKITYNFDATSIYICPCIPEAK